MSFNLVANIICRGFRDKPDRPNVEDQREVVIRDRRRVAVPELEYFSRVVADVTIR